MIKMAIVFVYATNRLSHRAVIEPIFNLMQSQGYTCGWGAWEPSLAWGVAEGIKPEDVDCYVDSSEGIPTAELRAKSFAHWHGLHPSEQAYVCDLWYGYLSPGEYWLAGVDPKQIEETGKFPITGYAKLDVLFKPNIREETIAGYGLDLPYDKTVLYAPTGNWHWATSFDKSVMHILNLFAGLPYNLIVKVGFERGGLLKWDEAKSFCNSGQHRHIRFLDENPDVTPLYSLSDVLISDGSSTPYEFIGLDKPAIQLVNMMDPLSSCCPGQRGARQNCLSWDGKTLHSDGDCKLCGGTIKSTLPNLKDFVVNAIENPNEFADERRRWAKLMNQYVDGRCAERCVKAIKEMAQI